jgi:pilus assembly protein CpaF
MIELIVALNTGHEGGAATLHANSAGDVPARFTALGALAGLPAAAVTSLVASAIDVVVHLRRGRDGCRVVSEIALLRRRGDELAVESAWSAGEGERPAGRELGELLDRRAAVPP